MSDTNYIQTLRAAQGQREQLAVDNQRAADDDLRAKGGGLSDQMRDFDTGAMRAEGMPLDGTMSNRHAKPLTRIVGSRDARTGERLVSREQEDPELWVTLGTSEMAGGEGFEVRIPRGEGEPGPPAYGEPGPPQLYPQPPAPEQPGVGEFLAENVAEAGRIGARGVLGFGRGALQFGNNVYNLLGGDNPPIMTAGEMQQAVGLGETEGMVNQIAEDAVRFGIMYSAVLPRLQAAFAAPGTAMAPAAGVTMQEGAAASAVAEGLNAFVAGDPRHDALFELVTSTLGIESALGRQLTPVEEFLGRTDLAVEGMAAGAILDGIVRGGTRLVRTYGPQGVEAAKALWRRADDLEAWATQGMRAGTYTLNSGLDPQHAGYLVAWSAARIMKGTQQLNDQIVRALTAAGATYDQIVQAWNIAAGMTQKARRAEAKRIAETAPEALRQRVEDEMLLQRLEEVPGFERLRELLTPGEIQTLLSRPRSAEAQVREAAQILNTISQEELVGGALAGVAKKGWYRNSAEALTDIFGEDDARRFAALLAATSPQTSVESNLRNTVAIWTNWVQAGRPTDERTILRIMGESVQGEKGEESILPAWRNNSILSLQTPNAADIVLSGPKADSFMRNLQGAFEEVTNDTWQAHATGMLQKQYAGFGPEGGKGAGYLGANAAVRQAARTLSELTGEEWTPAEVQETVWSFMRTLYLARESEGFFGRTAPELIEGLDVRDTPDFGTLLESEEMLHQQLMGAGYGRQLEQYAERRARGDIAAPGAGLTGGAHTSEGAELLAKRAERLYRERAVASAAKPFRPVVRGDGVEPGAAGVGYRPDPGRSGKHDPLAFGGTGERLVPSDAYRLGMSRVDIDAPDLYRLSVKSKPQFKRALAAARDRDWLVESSVDLKPNYRDDAVFLTNDGQAGFAIAPSGEIHSVFSSGGGITPALLQAAIEQGGRWLYAFDTVLPGLYARSGFKPVSRIPWVDDYAPPKWDYGEKRVRQFNGGRPDLVFMTYDPAYEELVRPGQGGKKLTDFDAAEAIARGNR